LACPARSVERLRPERAASYRLEPDDDEYPPVSTEGLWVRSLDSGTVILDNIPFYAKGIAPGDDLEVLVERSEQCSSRLP